MLILFGGGVILFKFLSKSARDYEPFRGRQNGDAAFALQSRIDLISPILCHRIFWKVDIYGTISVSTKCLSGLWGNGCEIMCKKWYVGGTGPVHESSFFFLRATPMRRLQDAR